MRNNLYAVILAGGTGTRFWPLSRRKRPKQFLTIMGRKSLFEQTIERVRPKVPARNILIVTSARYKNIVRTQARPFSIPAENFLYEPEGKNTASAIVFLGLSAVSFLVSTRLVGRIAAPIVHLAGVVEDVGRRKDYGVRAARTSSDELGLLIDGFNGMLAQIQARDRDAVMAVLPSDHLIQNPKAFHRCLDEAVRLAERDLLVTFGIVPTRAETGYGYLKIRRTWDVGPLDFVRSKRRTPVLRSQTRKQFGEGGYLRVVQFVEKPTLEKAKRFLRDKSYLWNSGMFVWKAAAIREALRRYLPEIFLVFEKEYSQAHARKYWKDLPNISIDYGILEKAGNVAAVAASGIRWSDVGSWETLFTVSPKTRNGNVLHGDVLQIDCRNVLAVGSKRLIAMVGLSDVVIVDTPDALLVCRSDKSQRVRDVISELKTKKRKEI